MRASEVADHAEVVLSLRSEPDALRREWREVMGLRRSLQQLNGRLIRTAPVVAELATSYPGLRDAVRVVNVLVANVGLADDVLGRVPIPAALIEEVE
jgi:hypothetical protein